MVTVAPVTRGEKEKEEELNVNEREMNWTGNSAAPVLQ